MKISLLVIGCIPLLGGLVFYGFSMADGPDEEDEGLSRKESTTEERTNPTTTVTSYQEQYQDGKMMFEKRVKHFGVVVSFKATTNQPTDSTQTAKVPDPTKPNAPFITETIKKDNIKENMPLDMATGPLTPVKFGMGTFKDQGPDSLFSQS